MKYIAFAAALAATPVLADQSVSINFAGEIAGKPFSCAETFDGIGPRPRLSRASTIGCSSLVRP